MRAGTLLLSAALLAGDAYGQQFDFYSAGQYRAEVPRPSAILGYEPGEFHTDYGNMLAVLDAIAGAAQDRVRMLEYGRSVEGRPLRALIISSPDNVSRLEEIRLAVMRLRDPRATNSAAADAIAASTPAIAWLNYANDGDESAALEAALQVAYQLAAGDDAVTRALLDQVVTVLTPAHNPESHERFVAWYNAFARGDSAHAGLEHEAPWGMRTNNNHYQIDLNRDALGITQRETRALVALFHRWNPQVFVDHHGQTTQYYFPPPMLPINPSLPKDQVIAWTDVYGRANAEAFDRFGWNYYVRDIFDLHYPGYWDSWPALNGATGMTYETDGGGYKGYRWRRDDDTILTLRDGIARHFTASLATLRATADNRERRLRDYHEFFRSGMNEFAASRPWKRFVVPPGTDPERAARLVETLLRHGIEVRVTTAPFSARVAHDYVRGEAQREEFPAGTYVVDLAQPQARLVDALLAPDAEIDPEFVREQLRKRALNARRGEREPRERDEFYDITAWSLPLSFGVGARWLESASSIDAQPIDVEFDETTTAWKPPAFLGVRELSDLPATLRDRIDGGVDGAARTAYVFRYDRNASARLAIALMDRGYRVAIAGGALRAGGRSHPRGSFVARVERNPESLQSVIAELATRFGVPVQAVNTAYADEGDTGVGSEPVVTLRFPRVAVLADEGISSRSYGHIWFTLDREFGLPFTALRLDAVTAGQLKNFEVIVLPNGSTKEYERRVGEKSTEALKNWISAGGVAIGLEGGARFLADPDLELTSVRLVGEKEEDGERGAEPIENGVEEPVFPEAEGAVLPPLPSPTAGEDRPLEVPGSIMRASLDLTHPLTFGYEHASLPVLVRGADFFTLSEEGSNPVVFSGDDLVISGFAWPDNTERFLDGTAWLVDEPVDEGRVILFADDPNFRLIWPSLSRLFLNAILIGPSSGELR